MKKRIITILTVICMTFTLTPVGVWAAAEPADGGDISTSGIYLTEVTAATRYTAGSGYALFTPASGGGNASLVLHGATVSGSGGDAALLLPAGTTVTLEGQNIVTTPSNYAIKSLGALSVTGSGSLNTSGATGLGGTSISVRDTTLNIDYPNGQSGINSGAGDVTILGSTVAVKSSGAGTTSGSGAILANDNQGINGHRASVIITDSKVIAVDRTGAAISAPFGSVTLSDSRTVAIGSNTSDGAIYYDYGNFSGANKLTVDGGTLYAKNTASGTYAFDAAYSSAHNTAANGAKLYFGGSYNSLIPSGSCIAYAKCVYDENTDAVTFKGACRINGAQTYAAGMKPDSGNVAVLAGASLDVPKGVNADFGASALINSGTVDVKGTLSSLVGISNNGTILGGEVNAVIMTRATFGTEVRNTYTASGNAVYSSGFVTLGAPAVNTGTESDVLTVPSGAALSVPFGTTLDATVNGITAANLSSYFSVSGSVYNDGTVKLPAGTTAEQVEALHLFGNGTVLVGSNALAHITYMDGNTVLSAAYAFVGGKPAKPADPVKAANDFAGWYKDAEGTKVWDFGTDTAADGTILYARWTPVFCNITFQSAGGSGTMPPQTVPALAPTALAANKFTFSGCVFFGWNTAPDGSGTAYADGAAVSLTKSVTLYAQWKKPGCLRICGNVRDGGGNPIVGAKILLRQGNRVVSSVCSDTNGYYVYADVPSGNYELSSTYLHRTVTAPVTVADSNVTQDILFSSAEVVVTSNSGAAAPDVMVGELDKVAASTGDSVVMTIERQAPDTADPDQSAIRDKIDKKCTVMFLNISLTNGGADIGGTNSTVLQIAVPFDFSRNSGVKVWRNHNGAVTCFTALSAKPVSDFADGTFFADRLNGMLYIFGSKYSEYAVAYTPHTDSSVVTPSGSGSQPGGTGSSGGSGSSGGTGNPATYRSDTNAPLSVNGAYLFRITSLNGKKPTFAVGTPGVFAVTLAGQAGNDYFFRIIAVGRPGDKAGIYVNGESRLLVAEVKTASAPVSDTRGALKVKQGQTYQFRVTADHRPGFSVSAPGVFTAAYAGQIGSDYFFRITAVGRPGGKADIRIESETPVCTAEIV